MIEVSDVADDPRDALRHGYCVANIGRRSE